MKNWLKYVGLATLGGICLLVIYREIVRDYRLGTLPEILDSWKNDGPALVSLNIAGSTSIDDFYCANLSDGFKVDGAFQLDRNRWSYSKLSEGFVFMSGPAERRLQEFRNNRNKLPEAMLQLDMISKSKKIPGYRSIDRFHPRLSLKQDILEFGCDLNTFEPGEYLIVGRIVEWRDRQPKLVRNKLPDSKEDWVTLDATGEFLFCRKLRFLPRTH